MGFLTLEHYLLLVQLRIKSLLSWIAEIMNLHAAWRKWVTKGIPEDSQYSLSLSAMLNPSICIMPSKETAFVSKIQEAWFILENIGVIMTWESRLRLCQMQRSHMEAVSWGFYSAWKKKVKNQSIFENTLVEPRRGTARWVLLCYWPWILSDNLFSSLIGGKVGFG